ncbi:TPA: hypothetical protein DCW56_04335 [Candidatus Peregrinibacteria bacterium]|nr:hypothetical protein [Candidatus Peregrinibacteria bacterium]
MDNSISDRSHGNLSGFVVCNYKFSIFSMLINTITQIRMKRMQFSFKIVLEVVQIRKRFLAFSIRKPAFINIF